MCVLGCCSGCCSVGGMVWVIWVFWQGLGWFGFLGLGCWWGDFSGLWLICWVLMWCEGEFCALRSIGFGWVVGFCCAFWFYGCVF